MPDEKNPVPEKKPTPIAVANREVVLDMATFLMDAVNAYRRKAETDKDGLAYIDAMMALHNLHINVLIDLCERTGNYYWLKVARDTFSERVTMEIKRLSK